MCTWQRAHITWLIRTLQIIAFCCISTIQANKCTQYCVHLLAWIVINEIWCMQWGMWNSLMPNRQNKFTTSRISKQGCINQMHQYGKTIHVDNWKWLQPISRYRLILCASVGLSCNYLIIYNARNGECEWLLEFNWKPQRKRPFGARWIKSESNRAIFVTNVQQNNQSDCEPLFNMKGEYTTTLSLFLD
jgi:hypothetical protein